MSTATTDIADAYPNIQICDAVFQDFGGRRSFFGQIHTISVFEDNSLVRSTLETPGRGRVLVVDGRGSLRCALVGGNLGALAVKNFWSGIVVFGCVRDAGELREQGVGIKALASHPRKSNKGSNPGEVNRPVSFAGVTFHPEHWLYADADGIVVSERCARLQWRPSGWKAAA